MRLYTCGPTVYNVVHIGNLRTFLFEDVLRRHLLAQGYRVTQIMNLTDVDDKTIRGAQEAGSRSPDFTAKYAEAFFRDIGRLDVEPRGAVPEGDRPRPRDDRPRSRSCAERGHTYESEGSVYFRIATFPDYGKLSRHRPDADAPRRARRRRRVREGGRQGLRALEGGQAGRAVVAVALGRGPARAGTSSAPR